MPRWCPWLCAVLALAPFATARGETFRTLIMVDASSSMRRTDPQRLRKVAAELYVDLARDGDLIAVAQFHAEAKDVSGGFLPITGPDVRDRLKDAIRAIGDDGDWTDFGAAFSSVAQAFAGPATPGEKRFLVFLTDGKCEPAPDEPRYLLPDEKPARGKKASEEREARCKQFVLSQMPALKGIEMEVVGLSKGAPREFLDELARRSGGRAVVTERAEDLPHLFAQIHAFNSGSRLAEAAGSTLTVDKLVASLDLVVVAPRDVELSLTRPDGTSVEPADRSCYYVRSERYRFFHLPRPAPGAWTLKPSRKLPAKAVAAIQNYDLQLQVQAPEAGTVGHPVEFKVALAAGEGGGMPEASFLARHRFSAKALVDGELREVALRELPDGARAGQLTLDKPGTVEIGAKVEPGPGGALTRAAAPAKVVVVPPLKLAFAPVALGALKPGTEALGVLDLDGSEFLGEVGLEARVEGATLEARPKKLSLKVDEKRFDVRFEVPEDASPGPLAGHLVLSPFTQPYVGREGARVPVVATILPLTFWEKHGGKVSLGLFVALLGFLVAGFKTPARFPPKLRVYYQDKPNSDEGDFGLWMRAKPGFYKPAVFKVGGGGPIRRSSALVCEIVATKDGMVVRPARGQSLKADGETFEREFRPAQGTKYQAEDGLVIWIGKDEEE